jgi:hypothetical protein
MLGTWASSGRILSWSASRRALGIGARAASGPAVEDRLAALNAGSHISSACDGYGFNRIGRLVDRAGSGLGHDHAAGGQGRSWRGSVRVAWRAPRWNTHRACRRWAGVNRRLGCGTEGRLFSLWSGSGNLGYKWSGNRSGLSLNRLNIRNGSRRGGNCRFDRADGLPGGARLGFAVRRSHWRLDHDGSSGRRYDNDMARRGSGAHRRLGDHRTGGRAGGNGRLSRGNGGGRRRLANRGNRGFALRMGWRSGRMRGSHGRSGSWGSWPDRRGRRWLAHRRTALCCFFFLFFLLGLNSLQHVTGLGDMRKIDLGRNALRGARRRGAPVAGGPRTALKMRAHLLSFIGLQRTGVGFAGGHAEFRKNVDNRARLHFQLARQIVDTNLTHPPLFKMCYPKPLSRS